MGNGPIQEVKLVIDGQEIHCSDELTILQAAQQVGIEIPTLCYSPDLKPIGECRICVVEVEGSRTLVGSCHTPVASGMVIHTHSPRVLAARRANIELMQAAHASICVTDPTCEECDLHKLCADLQVRRFGFTVRQRRSYPIEENNPYVIRDMSKCILCRRCVSACSEIAKKNILSIAYRGYHSKVVTGWDQPLTSQACRDCGICIDYCPTKALSRPDQVEAQRAG